MADPMANNSGMNNMGGDKMMCKCPHHKVMPVSFIVIGALFLLQGLGIFMGMLPAIVTGVLFIVMGVMKMNGGKCKCCSKM